MDAALLKAKLEGLETKTPFRVMETAELIDTLRALQPAAAPVASAEDRLIARRLDQVAALCASNPILAGELMPFIQGATAWEADEEGLVTGRLNLGTVTRIVEIEKGQIRIGRDGFPERKRIPW